MTQDSLRPRGFMTLQVFDDAGQLVAEAAHHNKVLSGGQALLLNLLKGDTSIKNHGLLLGTSGFQPDRQNVAEQAKAIKVQLAAGSPKMTLGDKTLTIAFKGKAEKAGKVIGGGLLVDAHVGQDKVSGLYNFAEIERAIEIAEGQTVAVNFDLAME